VGDNFLLYSLLVYYALISFTIGEKVGLYRQNNWENLCIISTMVLSFGKCLSSVNDPVLLYMFLIC
jgi:hypothetical protein